MHHPLKFPLSCLSNVKKFVSPDELSCKARCRSIIDLLRTADLHRTAMVHDHNPVRKCQRLSLIVSNIDHRATDLLAIALNLQLHTLPQFEIKRAKRFVHEQHAGLENDCPRKRDR